MTFWGIVFIVLMVIALVGVGWGSYDGASGRWNPRLGGAGLILWACVAILGYLILGGAPVVVVR